MSLAGLFEKYFSCCVSNEDGNDVRVEPHIDGGVQAPGQGGLEAKQVSKVPLMYLPGNTELKARSWSNAPKLEDQFLDWEIPFTKGANDGTKLGVSLLFYYTLVGVVQEVLDVGLIREHNDSKHDSTAVQPGDILLAVNGVTDIDEMLNCFTQATSLKLLFRRVRQFEAVLNGSLAADACVSADAHALQSPAWPDVLVLRAQDVSSGGARDQPVQVNGECVTEYNTKCKVGFQILPCDRVVEVNGQRTDAQDLIKTMMAPSVSGKDEQLRLLVQRPSDNLNDRA